MGVASLPMIQILRVEEKIDKFDCIKIKEVSAQAESKGK